MAAAAASRGIQFLDAPVSGGDIGAKNATLSIMVGGEEAAIYTRVIPLLRMHGQNHITHCGPSGTGQLTKLVNQILVTVTNLAVCEALTLRQRKWPGPAQRHHRRCRRLRRSWQLSATSARKWSPAISSPGFMIFPQQKDLRLILEARAKNAVWICPH